MKTNITVSPLDEIRRNILGFGIKNTFRTMQPFVAEISENGYAYTGDAEDMQSFLTKEEAVKAFHATPDNRYELRDFKVVNLYPYVLDEDAVDAFLTCLEQNVFQKSQDGDIALEFAYGQNKLVIQFLPYDNDIPNGEEAWKSGYTALEDGFISFFLAGDYDSRAITEIDSMPRFKELEEKATSLMKTTFNIK